MFAVYCEKQTAEYVVKMWGISAIARGKVDTELRGHIPKVEPGLQSHEYTVELAGLETMKQRSKPPKL